MKALCLLLACWLFASCSPPEVIMKSHGSAAVIHQKNGKELEGELLAIHDGMLLVAVDSLEAVPRSEIESVTLMIDEVRGWVAPVLLAQGLPSIVITTAVDDKVFGLVGLGITAVTWACFELSTPRTTFAEPINESDLDELSVHFRYPYGVSESQVSDVRKVLRNSPQRKPDRR